MGVCLFGKRKPGAVGGAGLSCFHRLARQCALHIPAALLGRFLPRLHRPRDILTEPVAFFVWGRMANRGMFDVRADVAFITRQLGVAEKQVPFLTAYALTKTAQDIKDAEYKLISEVFDRPTRFTLNSLFVRPATKTNLVASVEFKDGFGSIPAWRYLGPHVDGGGRQKKSHEKALERAGILRSDEWAVPGRDLAVDTHGNVPGKVFTRILSQLQASPDPMQNMTARSRKGAVKRSGGQYIVLRGRGGAPDGVYQRRDGNRLALILLFVRQPRYQKRFPFYEEARKVYDLRVAPRFREGFERYVVKPLATKRA